MITLLPYSVIAPFAGVFVDRWSRRKLLVGTNLVRGGILVTLPLWGRALGEDGGLFVSVLVLLGLGRLFLTTKGAVLPAVVHERSLVKANSVSAGGGMISALAGGAAGFGAVAIVGPAGAFAIAGVVYFGSAWYAHRLASSLAHPHPKGTRFVEDVIEIARDLREGLRTLWDEARLRLPLAGIFALRTVTVFVGIVAILFIKDAFPEADERAGRLSRSAIVLGVAGAG
ncbi:MAG TPA: MFS transporter, partial [Actinomycetota bacterium]|nr:MFS transporter [Actinomycetota bacterium]